MSLTIARAAWCEAAEEALMPAAFGEMDIVRAEVLRGISELWCFTGASSGWMVTRQEQGELVIVLFAGRNGRPVVRHVLAQASAARLSVRAHVRCAGVKRILEGLGFHLSEWVMRV